MISILQIVLALNCPYQLFTACSYITHLYKRFVWCVLKGRKPFWRFQKLLSKKPVFPANKNNSDRRRADFPNMQVSAYILVFHTISQFSLSAHLYCPLCVREHLYGVVSYRLFIVRLNNSFIFNPKYDQKIVLRFTKIVLECRIQIHE